MPPGYQSHQCSASLPRPHSNLETLVLFHLLFTLTVSRQQVSWGLLGLGFPFWGPRPQGRRKTGGMVSVVVDYITWLWAMALLCNYWWIISWTTLHLVITVRKRIYFSRPPVCDIRTHWYIFHWMQAGGIFRLDSVADPMAEFTRSKKSLRITKYRTQTELSH